MDSDPAFVKLGASVCRVESSVEQIAQVVRHLLLLARHLFQIAF